MTDATSVLRRKSDPRRWVLPALVALVVLALAFVVSSQWPAAQLLPEATPTPMPSPTPWPVTVRFASPEVGLNVHLYWDPWAAVRRDWHLVRDGGFTWVKQRLAWQDVESAGPGRYEWAAADRIVNEAEQAGVSLVFRVDYPPVWASSGSQSGHDLPVDPDYFGFFCKTLAARYRGRVRAYQVWNEPNLAREWGGLPPDPAAYVEVLRVCYIGIKAGDPDALVISAALAPTGSGLPDALPDTDYLLGLYEAGGAAFFDLLGVNAPGYKAPPHISPQEAADPANDYGGNSFFCFRHVEELRAIMERYHDGAKQIAVMEFGWHTNQNPDHADYAWFAVTPEQQAQYLVAALEYARDHWSPWVGPMFVWNLPDARWTPDNEEFWWAIADPFWWGLEGDEAVWPGGAVRPAYEALRDRERP